MDSHEFALATQLARHLCDCVATWAAEIGFHDGLISVVLHQGKVVRVHMELFDAPITQPHELRLTMPGRCVGLAEAQQILRDTLRDALQSCIVPYGNVTMLFSKGVLRQVTVTQTFRIEIEEEITDLGRIFIPRLGHPMNGHRSGRAPGGGNGEHR